MNKKVPGYFAITGRTRHLSRLWLSGCSAGHCDGQSSDDDGMKLFCLQPRRGAPPNRQKSMNVTLYNNFPVVFKPQLCEKLDTILLPVMKIFCGSQKEGGFFPSVALDNKMIVLRHPIDRFFHRYSIISCRRKHLKK